MQNQQRTTRPSSKLDLKVTHRAACSIAVAIAMTVIFGHGCTEPSGNNKNAVADKEPVLVVDGDQVTLEELISSFKKRGPGAELDPMLDQAVLDKLLLDFLDQEAERMVLLREAAKAGITISKSKVESSFTELKSGYSDESFKLLLLKRGTTEKDLKKGIRERLTIQKLLSQRIHERMHPVTELDVENYYKAHKDEFKVPTKARMRQILVSTREEARRIRSEILSGLDFGEAAHRYSITPDSTKGGDLGYFERGIMPKVFDEAAFSLEIGKVSQVTESEYGYHLFLVEDRTEPAELSLSEVRDKIRKRLEAERAKAAREAYLAEVMSKHRVLKQQETIEKNLGPLKASLLKASNMGEEKR